MTAAEPLVWVASDPCGCITALAQADVDLPTAQRDYLGMTATERRTDTRTWTKERFTDDVRARLRRCTHGQVIA